MEDKIKILTISDHPLSPSGVGIQTRYMIEALLKTGRYKVVSLGGAIKHQDYTPKKLEEWGDDWIIFPVDGYGGADVVRSVVRNERPDMLWFMTDPRFFAWLWQMEDEVRPLMPLMYYHVWDNYPPPTFNKPYYDSNDSIVAISKVTHDIVSNIVDKTDTIYHPHSVDTDIFKKLDDAEILKFRRVSFPDEKDDDRMLFFWNNRNARRKQSGTLIFWFKEFLDRVGHNSARLVMHTDPFDQHGQNLEMIIKELNLNEGQVLLSTQKIPPQDMSVLYNIADCTINISDAEGFGLSTLESLACETPIIVNMTGGLQEQVTDGESWFGIGLEPSSKSLIGSQDIPWIFEDRLNREEFIDALEKFYNLSKTERGKMGADGRAHVMKNYNFESYQSNWVKIIDEAVEKFGSWDNRKNYKTWSIEQL
tara:strand:+ start:2651 stop:3913 length:1263 start_codon:yes stop_codon:yes gene_type:complete